MSEQQLRILNEQWYEKGDDGKYHMYKAVKPYKTAKGMGDSRCTGCRFVNDAGDCLWEQEGNLNSYSKSCGCGQNFVIIELGILNDDGCLPSSWGDYPTISVPSYEKEPWCVYAYLRRKEVVIKQEKAWGDTEQDAVDNWNKR